MLQFGGWDALCLIPCLPVWIATLCFSFVHPLVKTTSITMIFLALLALMSLDMRSMVAANPVAPPAITPLARLPERRQWQLRQASRPELTTYYNFIGWYMFETTVSGTAITTATSEFCDDSGWYSYDSFVGCVYTSATSPTDLIVTDCNSGTASSYSGSSTW